MSSYLNEASFPSTALRRFSASRWPWFGRRGQLRRRPPAAVMLDLERPEPAQALDLGRTRAHAPPAAFPGELPSLQPTCPAPAVDHDRLHPEFRRPGRQPPPVLAGKPARRADATRNADQSQSGEPLAHPVPSIPLSTRHSVT